MSRTILVPTDFSQGACAALHYAGLIARGLGSKIAIVHVKPSNILPHAEEDVADPEDAHIHAQLEESSVEDAEIPCTRKLLRGNPPDEIIKICDNDEFELIVMGTHGQTNSPDVAMGAIAQAVVRRATCPVLAVKPAGAIRVRG